MKRNADLEGRRLVVVRAADRAGFWYTENFVGFGDEEGLNLSIFKCPVYIISTVSNSERRGLLLLRHSSKPSRLVC